MNNQNYTEGLDISVIMPALNEARSITAAINNTLKALTSFKVRGEIIVVNDGSSDQTQRLVEKMIQDDGRIRLIRHAGPQGIGASFWDGVDQAQGQAVVLIPADNENYPVEILRYYRLLDQVDIVIPFIFNKKIRGIFRNTLSFIYRFIINTTFGVLFNYTNGTVLYRKSILKDISHKSRGFFFQTDILIRAVKKEYLFAEVPYKLGSRKKGKSSAVTFPSLLQVLRGYFQLVGDLYFTKDKDTQTHFSRDSLKAQRRNKN
ncbi:MAG: glycosyltransferase family 2 protein [Candidatus Omnitrophica bacterium]|nr:glycosyltransferase family 2 protein [Candidatus Omnitrophota bacterium]